MVETLSPTFINDPMFTFRLANALFLEATDVVFLDELFFPIDAAVCFCIDLQGDLNFIFTSSFSIKFYIWYNVLRVDQPRVMQLGTPECPGGLRAGWLLLVVPVVVALVSHRSLQGPLVWPWPLGLLQGFFSWAFCYTDSGQSGGPRQAISNLSVTSPWLIFHTHGIRNVPWVDATLPWCSYASLVNTDILFMF